LKGEVKITGGLGFINNVIIDTHFVQRGRIGRLMYACASNPINLGIGLGEDTGLLITDGNNMEAIGSGLGDARRCYEYARHQHYRCRDGCAGLD
jgi:cyanophycinase